MNYKKIFKKGEGKSYEVQLRKIVEKVGKGLTFSKMFRVKQKEDKKGLTFGGDLWRFEIECDG